MEKLNLLLLGDFKAILNSRENISPYRYFTISSTDRPYLVFMGLQKLFKDYLSEGVSHGQIEEALLVYKDFCTSEEIACIGDSLYKLRNIGYIPLTIKALPEGTIIEQGNALFSLEVTDDEFLWVADYLLPIFSKLFYSTMVATEALRYKIMFEDFSLSTTGFSENTDRQLIDYSSFPDNYPLSIFFKTSNEGAINLIKNFYNADLSGELPAIENYSFEGEYFENLLGFTDKKGVLEIPNTVTNTFDEIVAYCNGLLEGKKSPSFSVFINRGILLDPRILTSTWELIESVEKIKVVVARDDEQEKFTYITLLEQKEEAIDGGRLLPVAHNGQLLRDWGFDQVRACANYHRDFFRD